MAFLETPIFPDTVSFGAKGGPKWNTTIVNTFSGAEARNQNWQAARHFYNVDHVFHDKMLIEGKTKLEMLRAHFMIARGRLHGFRFRDWSDYTCVDGIVAKKINTAGTFELWKRYQDPDGASWYDRRIYKPRVGSIAIFLNGNESTGMFNIDETNGTFTSYGDIPDLTIDVMYWTGEFDVPVRFNTDMMQTSLEDMHNYGHWNSIELAEIQIDP